jgi:hypothetical protein
MGWSCRAEAGDTMRAMDVACVAQTGSSNSWRSQADGDYDPSTYDGKQVPTHFWERSNVEHADGRITGTAYKMLPGDMAQRTGRVRISAEGKLEGAPASLRAVVEHYHGRSF